MRLLLQTTTRSAALSPSAAVSIAAHAVLVGGAWYSNGRSTIAAPEVPPREAIIYLYSPPPDRAPPSRESEGQLRYVQGGSSATPDGVAPPVTPLAKGSGGVTASAAVAQSSGELTSAAMTLPLASSNDSVYSVLSVGDSAARDLDSAAPVYPAEMLSKLIEGTVTARYVIDSTGHPEAASAEIVSATHDEFARSVREALPQMRFRPGSAAGHPVRQLVEQEFLFRITPPAPPAADNTRTRPTG